MGRYLDPYAQPGKPDPFSPMSGGRAPTFNDGWSMTANDAYGAVAPADAGYGYNRNDQYDKPAVVRPQRAPMRMGYAPPPRRPMRQARGFSAQYGNYADPGAMYGASPDMGMARNLPRRRGW